MQCHVPSKTALAGKRLPWHLDAATITLPSSDADDA
jgi:hypothetical protein